MIVEYKNHLVGGFSVQPNFIISGGFFFKPEDKTYLGVVDNNRDYWIPDSLIEVSEQEAIDRALEVHSITPYLINDTNVEGCIRNMTEEEIVSLVESLYLKQG
jgi:hypothetical protein